MIWDWIKQKFRDFFSSLKRTKINASYDDDLFEILEEVGIYNEIEDGNLECGNCGVQITKENLSAIVKQNGEFIPICEKPSCLTVLS